jgi:hypothetical protein
MCTVHSNLYVPDSKPDALREKTNVSAVDQNTAVWYLQTQIGHLAISRSLESEKYPRVEVMSFSVLQCPNRSTYFI